MAIAVMQLAAILAFPSAVSGGVSYFAKGDLRRPWLYFLVATVVLYVIYGLIFIFLGDSIAEFVSLARGDASRVAENGFAGLPLLKLYAKPLLGFSVMALPILAGIYVIFRQSE